MNSHLGLVNKALRFSGVDGPGNRFVLFLQGCNFNCINCHNPYTISVCNSCGICVEPCPEGALSINGDLSVTVDWALCTLCEVCIEICPYDSTPLATEVTVKEVLDQIRETAPFLSGITVSGGEATLQAEFVAGLFAAIKVDPELSRLSTFVDSNGAAPGEVWDLLAPVMDGAMIDLKALDPETHRRLTGTDNDLVLDSICYLTELGKLYEVRLLIVPGYNDDTATMVETVGWLREVDPNMRIKVIGFRSHGVRPQWAHLSDADPSILAALGEIVREAGFREVALV
ncbi:MAG: YjjW family glycine radical enzyme activase [Acidimicrobiia bacterium]